MLKTGTTAAKRTRLIPDLGRRAYKVLAIETSCDDSCVALLDRFSRDEPPTVVDHLKSTLDSRDSGGIIPTKAFVHHQQNLARLVREMCVRHDLHRVPPDLICVTRGPGMPGSLNIGCDTAKGLAVAWDRPLVGVHHMLAHLLVPRLAQNGAAPRFPFFSLLISGGHTMLVQSKSLIQHDIVVDTLDIAAGDALDKCARLLGFKGNMIAREMAHFIDTYDIKDGGVGQLDLGAINPPLQNKPGRKDIKAFSFSPFNGMVVRTLEKNCIADVDHLDPQQKYAIASQVQSTLFQHIADKIELATKGSAQDNNSTHFVVSGGVSANQRLRTTLEQRFPQFEFFYPQMSLCTDNAVMIAWAGIELYEAYNLTTGIDFNPIRKWPLNEILISDAPN